MRRVQPPISRKDRDLDRANWRVFTCTAGSSNKFWKIRQAGRWMETWWGRTGTQGQRKVKEHDSQVKCYDAVIDLVHQKRGKGYVEQAGEWETPPGNVVTRQAFEPTQTRRLPVRIRPDRLREVAGNEVAVYAQRDVYGTGLEASRVVHERGHRQLLPSAVASEIVSHPSSAYGYWHPDSDTDPPDSSNELTAIQQVVAENFRDTSEILQHLPLAFEGSAEEEARRLRVVYQPEFLAQFRSPQAPPGVAEGGTVSGGSSQAPRGMVQAALEDAYQQIMAGGSPINSGRGRSSWDVRIGCEDVTPLIRNVEVNPRLPNTMLFTEMDVSGYLGNEPWRCYGKGTVKRWLIRRQGIYVETANTEDGDTGPRRGRKFENPRHAMQARDVYIQAMIENGFHFLGMQSAAIPLGGNPVRTEPVRKWKTIGPSHRGMEAVAWHVLIKTDAVQEQVYWRIRYTGRMLETWSGGNQSGSERGVHAARLYDFEADVLPDVHELILEKLRRGFYPPEYDDLVRCVLAGRDPDLWTVVQERMAVGMTRGTVALGRFSTIDEEEDIL